MSKDFFKEPRFSHTTIKLTKHFFVLLPGDNQQCISLYTTVQLEGHFSIFQKRELSTQTGHFRPKPDGSPTVMLISTSLPGLNIENSFLFDIFMAHWSIVIPKLQNNIANLTYVCVVDCSFKSSKQKFIVLILKWYKSL